MVFWLCGTLCSCCCCCVYVVLIAVVVDVAGVTVAVGVCCMDMRVVGYGGRNVVATVCDHVVVV